MRQVRCCCGVGTAPESGTFRSAQSFLIGISRGRADKEVASAMQCGELPAGPWRNQCCLREVQGQQGLLYFEPGHQLSRDQYRASPCLAGKGALISSLKSPKVSYGSQQILRRKIVHSSLRPLLLMALVREVPLCLSKVQEETLSYRHSFVMQDIHSVGLW